MNAYDIETFIDKKGFFIPYCVCFNISKRFFNTYLNNNNNIILESIDIIFNNIKKYIYIYIHNIQFDGFIILDSLSKDSSYIVDILIKNNSIYYISIKKNNKKIIFKCSYKIIPSSLKKISKSFGLNEKMPFPYKFSNIDNLNYIGKIDSVYFNNIEDYNLFINNNKFFDFKNYSIKYCTNDVLITSSFLNKIRKILNEFNIDINKSYSAPSLSLKIFEKKFNKDKISFKNKEYFDSYIRPSYYGGKCEVYGNPKEKEFIFHFDFSGMYAQCMKEKFCFGRYRIIKDPENIDIPGFYWIKWKSNSEYLPILPHHSKKNNKLMFTNGTIEGCYWFEEIKEFIANNGIILDIKSCIIFDYYDYIFNDFVDYFTKIRELSESHKIFGKLMINSLYGRMGMNNLDNYSFFIKEEDLDKYLNLDILSIKKINNMVLLNVEINNKIKDFNIKIKKDIKKNISIASAITSKSRIKLYRAQKEVIKNNGRILYSDTDSIFASFNRDVSNEKHGEIFWDSSKYENMIEDAVFISPKTYSIVYKNGKEITKIKGFDQNVIDFKTIKHSFYNNKNNIIINENKYINKRDMFIKEIINNKTLNIQNYEKRLFLEDKKDTIPLYTNNGIDYKSHTI